MSSFDEPTLGFYSAQAKSYVSHRPDEIDPQIAQFLDLLKPGARILELGCGGGVDAAHMISRGFDVDPTDGVAEMAAIAEQRLTRDVRVMRFDELATVETYDAVIANASLLHVPTEGLPEIFARIWTALRPGGWHFATFKTGAASGYDRHGRYYNYLSRAEAKAALSRCWRLGIYRFRRMVRRRLFQRTGHVAQGDRSQSTGLSRDILNYCGLLGLLRRRRPQCSS